jgi:hypothetical protein
VLFMPKERPRRPSPLLVTKAELTDVASSMACFLTTRPPMCRSSRPTMPLAVLSSPYVIFQVLPSASFQVELFVGSNAECFSLMSSGRRVLYTHVSADPVSKFSLTGCGGVPMPTSAMYRELCSTSSALFRD